MKTTNNAVVNSADREIVLSRVFKAPRELVWKAWTDPERVRQWWGPKHFTAPHCTLDFRVGGIYLFCMRAPDGRDYWTTGVYREIVPMDRIVYTDSFADEHGNRVPGSHYGMGDDFPEELVVTLTFEEHDGKTRFTLQHAGMPAGTHREMASAGWNESLDKLAASLTMAQSLPITGTRRRAGMSETELAVNTEMSEREIVSARVFDAPRERVFRAWTDPKHLARWWGPKGFTNTFHEFDPRPGGIWRFVMHGPDGTDYKNKSVFVEIVEPERIVFDHVTGPKFRVVATFADESGKTALTFRMRFKTAAACEKVKVYAVDANEQNFDRLEAELAKMV